jgi:uncharacterized protein YegL
MDLTGSPNDYVLYKGHQALRGDLTLAAADVPNGAELLIVQEFTVADEPRTRTAGLHDFYVAQANAKWPALIIYLIDVSGSMSQRLGGKKRIEVVEDTLQSALKTMVRRSLRGNNVSPRYRIAMFTYSDKVRDVYDGIKTIGEIMRIGIPDVSAAHLTNTAGAFAAAKQLLEEEIKRLQKGEPGSIDGTFPTPLVCHLTDGEYTPRYGDPEPIANEIKQMRVPDGHVLVENIFISDELIDSPIDARSWSGFKEKTTFPKSDHATRLLGMSSRVPESYGNLMRKAGYPIETGTVMLYPGTSPELVEMAFQMSVATPIGQR